MKTSPPRQLCRLVSLAAATLMLSLALPAVAQVPQMLSYQGRVTVSGAPFTGAGQFKFALVNDDGSTSFWSNDGTSVGGAPPAATIGLPVVNGLYTVPLGDTTLPNMAPVPPSVFSSPIVKLRVWFDDGVNGPALLSPDQRITSVGYAMVADKALSVANNSVSGAGIQPGSIDSSKLSSLINTNWVSSIDGGKISGTLFQASVPGANVTGGMSNAFLPVQNLSGQIQPNQIAAAALPKFDRQIGKNSSTHQLQSGPADLPGLSLTTKNLGGVGTYVITFNAWLEGSNTVGQFLLNINGTDVGDSWTVATGTGSGPPYSSVSLSYLSPSLPAGTVIKVRGMGQSRVNHSRLVIDGVLATQVAQ